MKQSITERAFKVRSGKIISSLENYVKSSDAATKISKFIEDEIAKYFGKQPDCAELTKKFYAEYGQKLFAVMGLGSKPVAPVGTTKEPILVHSSKKEKSKKAKPAEPLKVEEPPKPVGKKPIIAETKPTVPEKPKAPAKDLPCDILFSFDDTGSISACRRIVRDYVDKMSADLLVKFKDLNIGVMIHGDYCDPVPDPCVELGFTQDWVSIKRFLEAERRFQGGDAPECYEYVLRKAQSMNWRLNSNKILVLIGDDQPHAPSYHLNKLKIDWKTEANKLKDMGVQIVSVQARDNTYANSFYQGIADITSGCRLRLTQFNQVADMLTAICYKGNNQLETYRATKSPSLSSPAFKRNLDILDGKEVDVSARGLTDFQMFEVPYDVSIRSFVTSLGMEFSPGRGYYEFTKRETVQSYKKIVVQDRETEVFYPDAEGRAMLKLPSTSSAKIHPRDYGTKYRFFIQSTSYNRVLKKGTTLLYDVTGLD